MNTQDYQRLCNPQLTRRDAFCAAAGAVAGAAFGASLGAHPTQAWAHDAAGMSPYEAMELPGAGLPTVAYATPYTRTAEERQLKAKRVLVVVDYQVDFVDGCLGPIPTALAIEDALAAKVREYQDAGDIVIYTMDTHPADNYFDTREGQVNPLHCEPGTPGWEVYGKVGELLTPQTAIMVKKGTFGSRDLPFVIQSLQSQGVLIESIEMAGVSLTCRVLHNAIILYNFFPELPVIFDDATTASYTDERTAAQLDELEAWGFIVRRNHG